MTATPTSDLTIAGYLCERLRQLSINTVFGVPGDFNLLFLTRLREHGFSWIGTANELNAAYAADGFARASDGPSVLVTTFGVGQISAFNGVAGAQAEMVPLIHIVGAPATNKQDKGLLLHHSLGDRRFSAFGEMSKHLTSAQIDLYHLWKEGRIPQADPSGRLQQIAGGDDVGRELDRVLEYAVRSSRPVDIIIPQDLVDVPVSPAVQQRLALFPLNPSLPDNDSNVEKYVLEEITRRILESQRPMVIGDLGAARQKMQHKVQDFVQQSGLPYFAAPMGRGVIDEQGNPQFGGVYSGALSRPEVLQASDIDADLAVSIGALWCDLNTGNFTTRAGAGTGNSRAATIELHAEETVIGYAHYAVGMGELLPKLSASLAPYRERLWAQAAKQIAPCSAAREAQVLPSIDESLATLTQESLLVLGGEKAVRNNKLLTNCWFWPRMSHFLREGDCILAETGNTLFAFFDVPLPPRSTIISQIMWGSIGYGGGAILGACLSQREKARRTGQNERTVMVIGDGSWQMTIQELGTVIREGLTPLIFLINNDGYQVEREIWGKDESFNDITPYNWECILKGFQPPPGYRPPAVASHARDPTSAPTAYYAVRTQDDVEKLLNDADFARADKCTLVEVILPRADSPSTIRRLGIKS